LLIYAARRILEPTLLIEQTPSLLILLAQIDLFRKRALAIVYHVRRRDGFLSSTSLHEPALVSLTDGDIQKLEAFVRKSESMRALYRGLVNRCIRLVRTDYSVSLRL